MKTIFAFLALAMFLFGCGSRSGHRVPKSQMKDSLATVSADTTDSMKFVFDELQADYLQFLDQNKEFDLDDHTTKRFAYKDSLGKEVWLEVFDLIDYAGLDQASGSYSVVKEGERYVVHTYTGNHKDDDSLVVVTPEELKMVLLPFHVHMKEATIAVAKLKIERSAKMKEMMQSAL